MRHLASKVNAGAKFLITQLFFDNARYFAFVARARAAGITVPIIPGIMPITNANQVKRFTALCGATLPARLRTRSTGSPQIRPQWPTSASLTRRCNARIFSHMERPGSTFTRSTKRLQRGPSSRRCARKPRSSRPDSPFNLKEHI